MLCVRLSWNSPCKYTPLLVTAGWSITCPVCALEGCEVIPCWYKHIVTDVKAQTLNTLSCIGGSQACWPDDTVVSCVQFSTVWGLKRLVENILCGRNVFFSSLANTDTLKTQLTVCSHTTAPASPFSKESPPPASLSSYSNLQPLIHRQTPRPSHPVQTPDPGVATASETLLSFKTHPQQQPTAWHW